MFFRIKTNEINNKAFKIQRLILRMITGLSEISGEAILEVAIRRFQTQKGLPAEWTSAPASAEFEYFGDS